MVLSRGMMIIPVAIGIAITLLIVGSGYFYLSRPTVPTLPDEIIADLQRSTDYFLVTQKLEPSARLYDVLLSDTYARGKVSIDQDIYQVFFTSIDGRWSAVEMTKESVSCEKMLAYDFPTNLIIDCTNQFSEALSVDQYVNTVGNALTDAAEKTAVIGVVEQSSDDTCVNCIQISSGGETVALQYDPAIFINSDVSDIESGDTVVVYVTAGDDGTAVVSEIVEVGEDIPNVDPGLDADDIFINDPSADPSNGNTRHDARGRFDRDYSNIDIQILSDF